MRKAFGLAFVFLACSSISGEDVAATESELRAPPAVKAPRADGITFGRETHERQKAIPITKNAGAKPKVLFSVRLDDLATTEDVLVRGELTLSSCAPKDISGESSDGEKSPCSIRALKQSPYNYAPRFETSFVLADSPTDTSGPRIGMKYDTQCSIRTHHCTIAMKEERLRPQNAAQKKFVNLVVAANDARARDFDLMLVEQTHGMLMVTRVGANAGGIDMNVRSENEEIGGDIDIDREDGEGDPKKRHILYRVKLDGLQPHDVVSADGKLVAKLGPGPADCDPLITTELVLSKQPDGTLPKDPGEERLTAKNGINCLAHGGGDCPYKKSGAVELGPQVSPTMYLSLVAVAGRTCVPAGFKWRAANGGFLEAYVRR